jgi:hypothetical protein
MCPIQCFRYLILNILLIYVIQMYNVNDVFYISRRTAKCRCLEQNKYDVTTVILKNVYVLFIIVYDSHSNWLLIYSSVTSLHGTFNFENKQNFVFL